MPFTTKTRDELRDIIVNHIRARVRGSNVAPGSHYFEMATAVATLVHTSQASAQYLVDQILPNTCEAKFVELHAYNRGLERQPAAKHRGLVRVDASASGGEYKSILPGATLTAADGAKYVVTRGAVLRKVAWADRAVAPGSTRGQVIVKPNAGTISGETPAARDLFAVNVGGPTAELGVIRNLAPDSGTPLAFDVYLPFSIEPTAGTLINQASVPIGCVLEVEAQTAGAAGYVGPGETLTLDAPPADVSATATVLEMGGGGDEETIDEMRERILAYMAERPGSGNRGDFRDWARTTPGVRCADAFVYPAWRGPGSVDVVPFGLSGQRDIGELARAMIEAHIAANASAHDDVRVVPLRDYQTPVDVTIAVTIKPDFAPDFGIVTLPPDASQLSLSEVAITPASDMDQVEPGDRVLVVAGVDAPRLHERTAIGRTATALVLDEALPDFPSDTLPVVSSGPLGQAVIDAITGLFDGLGPGDTNPASRFPVPGSAYGESITRTAITDAVMDIEGVVNVSISAPTIDKHPPSLSRLTLGQLRITWLLSA